MVRTPHYLLATWMEPWGFIKPSAQNKSVHKELSIRLSFPRSHSLGGYVIGTIVEF
jgi:hypothetical protein